MKMDITGRLQFKSIETKYGTGIFLTDQYRGLMKNGQVQRGTKLSGT